ncbi:23 kDa jasmonate-induced protein-like [Diospyros lotus]|uniref:23 kDa jasmonate-induced protein-like n=1 Tax=Diospyros lotus TaxID=55363 RepID=UPI002250A783|nr:23 kDa jasmonate-induced protein-like [Diospyros lotus]
MASNVSSICLMKNETGGTLTFVECRTINGRIGPISYPQKISSGQWAMFVHTGDFEARSKSMGAVIYHCTNPDGEECDWMMSWLNTYGEPLKVYTEIMEKGHFKRNVWKDIERRLKRGTNFSEEEWEDFTAIVEEVPNDDCDVFAIFRGIITN